MIYNLRTACKKYPLPSTNTHHNVTDLEVYI